MWLRPHGVHLTFQHVGCLAMPFPTRDFIHFESGHCGHDNSGPFEMDSLAVGVTSIDAGRGLRGGSPSKRPLFLIG